jgi:hypothetical protein
MGCCSTEENINSFLDYKTEGKVTQRLLVKSSAFYAP